MKAASNDTAAPWLRDLLGLALFFSVLFAFRIGGHPLGNPDEGRYAEIPREMAAGGDWVTPRLDGVVYFEKPPLVYWAVAASLKAFGPGEAAARAVPALFGLAGVLLTYAAGRRLYGRGAGLASAVVLGTSALYFAIAHILLLDMAVSVLMSWTLFSFILAVREPPGRARLLFFLQLYAGAALATLAKGLIGFLLTGAVMLLWLVLFGQWRRLRPLHLPAGLLLFLAIALPWHILAALRNPGWTHRYLVYEHFQRFLTPAAGRPGAWWYFVPVVLGGLFPWVGFLWPAVRDALRGGWARRKENAAAWFLVTWAAFIFLFFSKSHSKLVPYILPVFPPLAVLIGAWLAGTADGGRERLRAGLRAFSFACGLLAAAVCVVVLRPAIVRMDAAQALSLRPCAFALAAILVLGGALVPLLAAARGTRAAVAGIAVLMALFFGVFTFAAPHIVKPGTKPLALIVKASAGPGDRVFHYHGFFDDFTFYAGRTVDVAAFKGEIELEEDAAARAGGRFVDEAGFRRAWAGPGRVFAVARKADARELFADPAFQYRLLGETEDHYLFVNRP